GLVTAWKLFCYSVGTLVAGALLVQLWFFGHILYWNSYAPASTAFMERRVEALRLSDPAAQAHQQWVPYERISVHLKRATVGAEAAARYHVGVPASALSQDQAAWLAAILPSPRRYQRGRSTPYLAERIATISARMGDAQIP